MPGGPRRLYNWRDDRPPFKPTHPHPGLLRYRSLSHTTPPPHAHAIAMKGFQVVCMTATNQSQYHTVLDVTSLTRLVDATMLTPEDMQNETAKLVCIPILSNRYTKKSVYLYMVYGDGPDVRAPNIIANHALDYHMMAHDYPLHTHPVVRGTAIFVCMRRKAFCSLGIADLFDPHWKLSPYFFGKRTVAQACGSGGGDETEADGAGSSPEHPSDLVHLLESECERMPRIECGEPKTTECDPLRLLSDDMLFYVEDTPPEEGFVPMCETELSALFAPPTPPRSPLRSGAGKPRRRRVRRSRLHCSERLCAE